MPGERATGLKPTVHAPPPAPEQLKETALPMSTLPKFVAFDRKVRSHPPEIDPSRAKSVLILNSPGADLRRPFLTFPIPLPGASLELLL